MSHKDLVIWRHHLAGAVCRHSAILRCQRMVQGDAEFSPGLVQAALTWICCIPTGQQLTLGSLWNIFPIPLSSKIMQQSYARHTNKRSSEYITVRDLSQKEKLFTNNRDLIDTKPGLSATCGCSELISLLGSDYFLQKDISSDFTVTEQFIHKQKGCGQIIEFTVANSCLLQELKYPFKMYFLILLFSFTNGKI